MRIKKLVKTIMLCICVLLLSGCSTVDETINSYDEVELTIENWNEYFEFKQILEINYDSFGDPLEENGFPAGRIHSYLMLKDGYELDDDSDAVMKVTTTIRHCGANIDYDKKTYEITEYYDDVKYETDWGQLILAEIEQRTDETGLRRVGTEDENIYGFSLGAGVGMSGNCQAANIPYYFAVVKDMNDVNVEKVKGTLYIRKVK